MSHPPNLQRPKKKVRAVSCPDDFVVRNLRRRLWQAFQNEDGAAALTVYKASKADLESWIKLEHPDEKKSRRKRHEANATVSGYDMSAVDIPSSKYGLLQVLMNPTDSFSADDLKLPTDPYEDKIDRRSANRRAASQSFIGGRSFIGRRKPVVSEEPDLAKITTPLHEAARLGNAELVRLMLRNPGVNCDVRDSDNRTILHCAVGGLTALEARYMDSSTDVGICVAAPHELEQKPAPHHRKSRLRRMFSRRHKKETHEKSAPVDIDWAIDGRNQLQMERTEVAQAILNFSRPVDRERNQSVIMDPTFCSGVSTNVVDHALGRTALHYAAELGRSDLCDAILRSFFGTMLTVIDSTGRTPCELAGENGHKRLAAYLEARALLYVDPYGIDENLLSQVAENGEEGRVAPFSWFESIAPSDVRQKREHRVTQSMERMKKLAESLRMRRNSRDAVFDGKPKDIEQDDFIDEDADRKPRGLDAPGFHSEELAVVDTKESDGSWLPFEKYVDSFENHLHRGHVEKFLSFHHWDVTAAMKAFFDNPTEAFRAASVPIPQKGSASKTLVDDKKHFCLICCSEFNINSSKWTFLSGCPHGFCSRCLGNYIADCSKTKATGVVVPCPRHECDALLSQPELARLAPSKRVYERLLTTADDMFVVSEPDFKFCPHPGCTCAVRYCPPTNLMTEELQKSRLVELSGAICTLVDGDCQDAENLDTYIPKTYEGVKDANYFLLTNGSQPKKPHRFCFRCGEIGIHWPVRCEEVQEWKDTIAEKIGEVRTDSTGEGAGSADFNDVAQRLWMKANTRPCPKKNEGCNHMTCSNPACKHEFCWICRNDWKKHSSDTGGFFRCNRWVEEEKHDFYDADENETTDRALPINPTEDLEDPRAMQSTYGTAMHESRAARKRSKEMARFLHHYERWTGHSDSAALERNMMNSACTRLEPVILAAIQYNGNEHLFDGKGIAFVHDAFAELMECRSMLQHSYAFSFLRYMPQDRSSPTYRLTRHRLSTEKHTFEQYQSDLELITEQISDVVARSHIRATHNQITYLIREAADKRKNFSNYMISNLLTQDKELRDAKNKAEEDVPSPAEVTSPRRYFPSAGLDRIVGLEGDPGDMLNETRDMVRETLRQFLETDTRGLLSYNSDSDDDGGADWSCPTCTYVNIGGRFCEMCSTRRPR